MPATPTFIRTRLKTLDSLHSGVLRSLSDEIGSRLTRLIDRLAPEGYEDEAGFHSLAVRSSDSPASLGELNCQGEHI